MLGVVTLRNWSALTPVISLYRSGLSVQRAPTCSRLRLLAVVPAVQPTKDTNTLGTNESLWVGLYLGSQGSPKLPPKRCVHFQSKVVYIHIFLNQDPLGAHAEPIAWGQFNNLAIILRRDVNDPN